MGNFRFRLFSCGVISLVVYGGMAWLSHAFFYGQGHRQRPILIFLGLYVIVFALYLLALHSLSRLSRQPWERWFILGFTILFRVTLLFSNPIQEDDFYRYLWDGKVVASGLDPYRFTPREVRESNGRDVTIRRYASIRQEDPALALILSRVNHPEVLTIYPPLAQGVFGLSALVAPGSLLALRLAFLSFDLGLCGLIFASLRRLGINPLYYLIYAWSPLVIKETINSAHYDVVPTFFLVLALLFSLQRRTLLAHSSFALAVLGKIYPLLLLPVFFWRTWRRQGWGRALLGLGVVVVVITLGYAPFRDAGPFLWQGTLTFTERWQTNSFLFPFLRALVGERWIANGIVVLLLSSVVILVLVRIQLHEEREFLWGVFLILGALFLLSPVENPWYFLWLVPLLCIFPLQSWLLLSGSLGLYYLSFYFIYRHAEETFRWVIWLEYVPFYVTLLWEWLTLRSIHGSASPPESFLRPAL